MSGYLKAIDHAVNLCVERGIQSELVMWHCPSWASESGKSGAWKPMSGVLESAAGSGQGGWGKNALVSPKG